MNYIYLTGHEHLNDFGLINMNGRMYDPLMSAFLSPDNYMQDPTSQQGFNRYAYCMYNPLKYVDPSGEQCFGWNGGSSYNYEFEMRTLMRINYEQYQIAMASTNKFVPWITALYSIDNSSEGNGSGNHGSPGGENRHASTHFDETKHNQCLNSTHGSCIITSMGIIIGGDDPHAWEARAEAYMLAFNKNPFDPNNMVEFVNWNPNPDIYHSYECEEIGFGQIYDAMSGGYVVSFMCDFTEEMVNEFGLKSKGHFVNLSYIDITENGCITIGFNDHPLNNYFIEDYKSCIPNIFCKDDYKRYMYHINEYKPIMEIPRVIKTRLIKTIP